MARGHLRCGLVHNKDDSVKSIVAFGGWNGTNVALVEIFDLQNQTWREGANPFPIATNGPTVVQYGRTFLAIGGRVDGPMDIDTIYKFDPATEDWVLMPERMGKPKHGVAAFLVEPEEFPSCS